jgi:serine/threonine-protein kinase
MGDITGTTFAGYEVRDVIGTDLVSVLHRATEPDEDRMVALRVIAQDLCEVRGPDRDLYRRFRTEAIASLRFEHPFSPTVEEVGEHHGRGYLVAPFIDTISLSQFLEDHPPLPLATALELFEGLADVLDGGLDNGLAHGAVNPSTVAFARPADGVPDAAYLVGYGIGALLELRLKRDRKQLTVVDDLLYVAPEQLRQQPVTGRTDQYALACALVHMLTGEPPFVRDSIGGLFGAHLFVEPELDAAHSWADAVRRGMAKEPEERFATCGELIAAIKADAAPVATRVIAAPTIAVEVPEPAPEQRSSDLGRYGAGQTIRSSEPEPRGVAVDADADADAGMVFARSTLPESRNGLRPGRPGDDEVPLLSEVLSQNRMVHGRRGPRPGAVLLFLTAVIAVAVVVWLVLS